MLITKSRDKILRSTKTILKKSVSSKLVGDVNKVLREEQCVLMRGEDPLTTLSVFE